MNKIIEPSLLSFDLSKVKLQLLELKKLGIKQIHYDVMDNKFVPNTAFGVEWLDLINECGLKASVHFMVEKPMQWIEKFIDFPCIDAITFHPEPISREEANKVLDFIKSKNIKAGIALRPTSPVNDYADLVKKCDLITILGVQPGFGGQKFMPIAIGQLEQANKIKKEQNNHLIIQLDGGVNFEVLKQTFSYAEWFVSGSFLMKYQGDKKDIIDFFNLLK